MRRSSRRKRKLDDRVANSLHVRKKAMDYLARREHGRVELTRKLQIAGFDPDIVNDTVTELVEEGLQSDRRFVEAFIAARISQGKGPVRIRAELRERNIKDSDVELGLEEAGKDWYALARDVRQRKFGSPQPSDFNNKAKQMRFLQYRGFEHDQIQAAVSADSD